LSVHTNSFGAFGVCAIETLAVRTVFGPIDCFWMESESPEYMLDFRVHNEALEQQTVRL